MASPTQPTFYGYDTLNNLVQVNQGVQVRSFGYDSLSRLRTATNPESGLIQYSYDNNGNLTQKTDARNVVTNYVYDNLNRVTNRNYTDGTPTVTYTYDNLPFAKGRLTQVASAISTTKYTNFDNLGRVLNHQQITDGQTYNTAYTYNLSGALVNETYPSGRVVTNGFETDGDLAGVVGNFQGQNKTYVGSFAYTSAGAVSLLQLGNGRWENTQFNSRLQPTQIGLGVNATDQSLLKLNYDYGTTDNNGNVKSQTITVPSQFVAVQNYSYDSLNRLKSAQETISGSLTWKQVYNFDRFGNRTFDAANTSTLGSCPANQCNPTIDQANNKFTTGQGYVYDLSGNLIQDAQNRTFYYNAEGKQKEVRDASNQIIGQYLYDGNGQRVKKIAANDTTIFVYDESGDLIAEYLVTTNQSQAPITSYLTEDTLGSPRIITDQAGNVQSRRDFHPFGEEISRANYGTDKIRKKFTSYERDTETDLDFAQARMYSSKLGRFITPDEPLNDQWENDPQSWNLYVYSGNSPLKYTDPSGKWRKVECEGKEGTLCYESDSEDDTYESLADLLGYAHPDNLAEFFQNQKISPGMVFDLSGYEKWRNEGPMIDMIGGPTPQRRVKDAEFVFGEGLKPERVVAKGIWGFIKSLLGIKAKPLPVYQRLTIFLSRLKAAPNAKNADEALEQISKILDKVEDSFSGVAKNPNPSLKPDGRMYPPQSDFITKNADGSISALTRGHKIDISSSGAIKISLRETGETVFTKP